MCIRDRIPDVRDAYTNQQIDAASIRVLTMATEAQQAEWIALFNSDDYCPTGQQLKAWLTGGGVIKALFDVADYGGTILTDLFGDHGQFADVEHFWEAQNGAIAKAIEAYKADGWKEVILGERGHYFPKYSHVHHPKDQGGRVYVEVRESETLVSMKAISRTPKRRRYAMPSKAARRRRATRPKRTALKCQGQCQTI